MTTLPGLMLLFLAMTLLVLALLGIVLWRRSARSRRPSRDQRRLLRKD